MQRLEVSGAVRPIYASLGFKELVKLPGTFKVFGRMYHTDLFFVFLRPIMFTSKDLTP